jgi:hypothetical protein
MAYVYIIRKFGWRGTFTFAQCRGILNVATGILRAKIHLTDKDIPIQRNPSWEPVGDLVAFEAAKADLMRIEKSAPCPDNLVIDRMQLEHG